MMQYIIDMYLIDAFTDEQMKLFVKQGMISQVQYNQAQASKAITSKEG